MNGISYINWAAQSDQNLAELLGAFVKHHRLEQNKTQEEAAALAGISRSTLSQLERGETVTLATLFRVLRILNQLEVLQAFVVLPEVSPLQVAKAQYQKKKRARGGKTEEPPQADW